MKVLVSGLTNFRFTCVNCYEFCLMSCRNTFRGSVIGKRFVPWYTNQTKQSVSFVTVVSSQDTHNLISNCHFGQATSFPEHVCIFIVEVWWGKLSEGQISYSPFDAFWLFHIGRKYIIIFMNNAVFWDVTPCDSFRNRRISSQRASIAS
jgi:hypothetical protein